MVTRANTPGKYKDFLEDCYSVIKSQKVTSFNLTKKDGLALCINFLGITVDSENLVLITMSVMENRKRKARLNAIDFARACSEVESLLLGLSSEHPITSDQTMVPYWVPLVPYLLDGWYSKLKCHRLFMIPMEYLWEVISEFTSSKFVSDLRFAGNLNEVAYYLKTKSHDLKLVTLSDK